jgi:hypothetical protein
MSGVVTKCNAGGTFGNDTAGFIRVRKRELKGGHPLWRTRATASRSFDLVRAVRVNGKPRHLFVLGLGSQKSAARGDLEIARFWGRAVARMTAHGLEEHQRRRLIDEMIRKGALAPRPEHCERARTMMPPTQRAGLDEILPLMAGYQP